ncbi:MAG: lipid-A-disaccharide synthase [Hymenobacteraceae bacterium]|nr:lipid-A-disaccharide synthase [Hymenobacteraceae bacterium]
MTFFFLAGERSGDQHAARLLAALCRRQPTVRVRAWGGAALADAGAEIVRDYATFSVMGFVEVAGALLKFRRLLREVETELTTNRPDAVVLVDFAGFNLRVARIAKRLGIRVYWYISPKLWAWGAGRVKTIAETVDQMLLILPFEADFYAARGFTRTAYVGNPVADAVAAFQPDLDFRRRHDLSGDHPLIAVLPGSRRQEVEEMLYVMAAIVHAVPDHDFVVAGVSNLDRALYAPYEGRAPNLRFIWDDTYPLLASARAALVTSGTATLETGLFGVPQVVCYATSGISYWLARMLIQVKFISLVNLIVGRQIVPELIQRNFNAPNLLDELRAILPEVAPARQAQLQGYAELKAKIGQPGAPDRAAELLLKAMSNEQ